MRFQLTAFFAIMISGYCFPQERAGQEVSKGGYRGIVTYVSAAGAGWKFALNVEKVFHQTNAWCFSGRAGYGELPHEGNRYRNRALPIGLYAFRNRGKGRLEYGLCLSYIQALETAPFLPSVSPNRNYLENKALYAAASFGYRIQRPTQGVFFRFAYTPLFKLKELSDIEEFQGNKSYPNFIEVSLGYSFRKKT